MLPTPRRGLSQVRSRKVTDVNQHGAADEPARLAALTERASSTLERASAAGDPRP